MQHCPEQLSSMIAYCGLDCEHCDAYIATKTNDQTLREKTAKLWSKLNGTPIMPEHINCEGCRVAGVKTIFCDQMCGIRQCALQRGVATCGHCNERNQCPKVAAIWQNNPEAKKAIDK